MRRWTRGSTRRARRATPLRASVRPLVVARLHAARAARDFRETLDDFQRFARLHAARAARDPCSLASLVARRRAAPRGARGARPSHQRRGVRWHRRGSTRRARRATLTIDWRTWARPARLHAARAARDFRARFFVRDGRARLHAARAARDGPAAAHRWLRRQALAFVPGATARLLAPTSDVLAGTGADLRGAARSLRRSPTLLAVVTLTLGFGVGASALTFTVLRGVLLRPLPFAEPERLVAVWDGMTRGELSEIRRACPPIL